MAKPVSLVLSDIDGTLVTDDKRVTDATRSAIKRLSDAGIGFTVTSSRPHFGMRAIVETLGLELPIGAFNGGVIAGPDLVVLEKHLIPGPAAQLAVEMLRKAGVEIWVFTDEHWVVVDPAGSFLPGETRTIATQPTVLANFDGVLDQAVKIVGASRDYAHLAQCEGNLQLALGGTAVAVRSQSYYLDITPPGVDKGTVLAALSRRLDIPPERICAIGDMNNDVAMLRRSGFPIAMGNGSEAAKAAASFVTRSNQEDGFAYAVDAFILAES